MREKVRAGQPYLYRKDGLPSEVFEIRMREAVNVDALTTAYANAMDRCPYFRVRYVEEKGDFYAIDNEYPLIVHEGDELPVLGGKKNNYYLIGISVSDNIIRVSFHHGLSDGRGIKRFVECFIKYYCKEAYGICSSIEEAMIEEEIAEPCDRKYNYDKTSKVEGLCKKALELPQEKNRGEVKRRCAIEFDRESFMNLCKGYGATPVIMLSIMMSRAIRRLNPVDNKAINCNIPVDVREELGVFKTYKNCVKSISLPYGESEEKMSTKALSKHYRELMIMQKDPDRCRKEFNNIIMLLDILNHLHSYKSKRMIMRFLDDLKLDTYLISYIGCFNFDECERCVEAVHLYSGCCDGLVLNLTCTGDTFAMDFLQDFEGDMYLRALIDEMGAEGLYVRCNSFSLYDTPKDEIMKKEELCFEF